MSIRSVAIVVFFFLAYVPICAYAEPDAPPKAVIYAYYRIGEDAWPDGNLRQEQFEAHLHEILQGGYTVLPLSEIVEALKADTPLPPNALALTFEAGYLSAVESAIPLLLEHNLPFTVFVSTNAVDAHSPLTTDWETLRTLKKKGATIGIHLADYVRAGDLDPEAFLGQLNRARSRYREELGTDPEYFAWPFGDYTAEMRGILSQQGFKAALGQQSSVAYAGSDLFALPRFTMTERFGDLDRFRLTAHALPLPVTESEPEASRLEQNPPSIGFSVEKEFSEFLGGLSCFASEGQKPKIQIVGDSRVELRLEDPFETDRVRINCTLRSPQGWHWYGMLFTVPGIFISDETP